MAKNSMGQFLAALRKANGMTQQEIADRLHVSNKAVSRWERDECSPELSLIPALAEIFGVTCDELLKGERIPEKGASEKKVDKQVKAMILRALSGFKTSVWIAVALAIVGFVCMFGISYGFYRPVIGFSVMMLFEICAFALIGIAVSRTKDLKTDNELFDAADDSLKERFHKTLGTMSFTGLFVILTVLLATLPFILINAADRCLNFLPLESYFIFSFLGVFLILAAVYLKGKGPYTAWVTDQKAIKASPHRPSKMTRLQVALILLSTVLFLTAPYFDANPRVVSVPQMIFVFLGFGCLLAVPVAFILFLIRNKAHRKTLVVSGVRNILLIPCALIAAQAHNSGWNTYPGIYGSDSTQPTYERYDIWYSEFLLYAIALAGVVLILGMIVETILSKKFKGGD